jgi:hypothetical protein
VFSDAPHDLNLLAAFTEGRLGEEDRGRVTRHLAECLECRQILATLGRALPAEMSTTARSARASFLSRPTVWLGLAATLVIATGSVLYLAGPLRSTTPASQPAPSTPASRPPVEQSPPAPQAPPHSQPAASPPASDSPDRGLQIRRSGERRVDGKTFRLVAGEWIDSSYDQLASLTVVEARTADERAALLNRIPALKRYAGLGNRVTVVFDNVVYVLDTPPR